MYKNLLPIGSVVRLKGVERNLMICGRVVTRSGADKVYDYVACLYPEGLMDVDNLYFFNREVVTECLHEGYKSKEENDFSNNVLGSLNNIDVVNGQIIPKKIEDRKK